MKAMQAMTRNVACVRSHDALETARDIMTEWEARHVPVTDDRKLVGIISDRDILLRSTYSDTGDHVVDSILVDDAMTRKVYTCAPSDSIAKVAAMMIDRKIDCVPVVENDGDLVGIVTSTDLLELLREKDLLDSGRLIPWSYSLRYPGSGSTFLE